MRSNCYYFTYLPRDVDGLKSMTEAALASPYDTAALTLLVLSQYDADPKGCRSMYCYLRGTKRLSVRDERYFSEVVPLRNGRCRNYLEDDEDFILTIYQGPDSFLQDGKAVVYLYDHVNQQMMPVYLENKDGLWHLKKQNLLDDVAIINRDDSLQTI